MDNYKFIERWEKTVNISLTSHKGVLRLLNLQMSFLHRPLYVTMVNELVI